MEAYHMVASSILPESKKKSPRTLYSLPGEEATPMPLLRLFLLPGTPRVDCLIGFTPGPEEDTRGKTKPACDRLVCAALSSG